MFLETGAVRTSYPIQNVQVEKEVRISQQEHELQSLRKSNEITSDYGFTETPNKSIVTQIPKVILTTPALVKPACSRNQYECRSSGDCIAIYNVCDGIPQCTDGSDEAADLVCPTEKPTVPPIIQVPQPPADILRYQQMIEQRKPLAPFYPAAPEINPKNWEISNLAHQMSQPQNILYPGQPAELPQLHKSYGSPGYQWDYQPLYEQNKDPYVPVNTFHEQNINPYEQQPHIFNHKGSSVIGNNEADRGLYMDSKHPYASHFPSPNKVAWQNNPVQLLSSVAPNSQHKQADDVEDSAKITTTPVCDTSEEHRNELIQNKEFVKKEEKIDKHLIHTKASKQVTEKPTLLASDITKHNHAKESKVTYDVCVFLSLFFVPFVIVDHKSVIVIEDHHVRAHERTDVIADHLQIIENDVLRPKGAVVSLSLGLIATAITAALIVCRLRVVKRRGRCGHGPYAHDADYLVNGMYL
ncbi:low-density lipoprotein receptor-related protein 11 [Lasius niger]|uniref:Low-density lipoprotein receptor-related protein 11 n=1 Tax=Lasius niger TaxID=67767 RepID=A0A0J7L1A7_LASNI|nr:low-density lipoprotein receptor-related protein 11 [Lasius niger]